jgi:hypothetical protein
MDYNVVSFYQGTGPSDPSIVVIQVLFNGTINGISYTNQPICANTSFSQDYSIIGVDAPETAANCEAQALSVLECVNPLSDNPNYDPSLSSCW